MNSVGYRTPNNMIIVSDEFDFRGSVYTETFSKINGDSLGPVVHRDVQRIEWRRIRFCSGQKCSEIEWRKLRDCGGQRRSTN
jgi:hypothetical protein